MKTITRLAAAAALLCLSALAAGALDLTEGRLRLTLYEGIGRFSLSYLSNSRESAYTPLLVAQDPRTTALSIVVGNKVNRLGEGSEFVQSVERTPEGARFVWKSGLLTVSQAFSFISAEGASSATGIRIDVEVKNTSRQDLQVGLRYLFDTYLGEASFLHFRTSAAADVSRELAVSGDAMPLYWVSPLAEDPEELGLQVMTGGEGITVPDRVVFANWKRLNDASWGYTTSSARNFNLLPYSVNDSAVAQYYGPRRVEKGTGFTVTLVLGKYNPAGFALKKPAVSVAAAAPEPAPAPAPEQPAAEQPPAPVAEVAAAPPAPQQQPSPEAAPAPPAGATTAEVRAAVQVDLTAVNSLIAEMDAKLGTGSAVTLPDIERLRAAVAELKARSSQYAPPAAPAAAGQ